MKRKTLTAADIAKIAGVSRSTVTGVVNDYGYISDATKEKVRAVITEYGYVPNSAARGLVGKKPKVIGHFVYGQSEQIHSVYIESLMVGVIEEAQRCGYSVMTSTITPERSEQVMTLLQNGTIQGAIVVGGSRDTVEIENLLRSRFPVVFVNKLPADFDFQGSWNKHIVKSDNVRGGYIATNHLISRGHTDIMHISGLLDRLSAFDRLQGYKQALSDNGLIFREDRLLVGDYTKGLAESLFDECVRTGDFPTAVFAANDMTAIGVMRSCRKNGLHVPDDISIVGFDDMLLASEVQPALTTMKAGSNSLALNAVSLLMEALDDDSRESKVRILEPELIERESVKSI